MLYDEKMDDRMEREGAGGSGIIWAKLFHKPLAWPGQIMFSELGDRVSSVQTQGPVTSQWGPGDTITDTIAILQIHSKIQYLQLSPVRLSSVSEDIFELSAHKIR